MARQEAINYTQSNAILGRSMTLDPNADITFLRANYDSAANTFTFVPTEVLPDAVRVNVRLANDSPNGSLALFFANSFGRA